MTVLVTGGTGFVGAHLVRALLERGDRVRCLVRRESRRDNLDHLDVALAEGDLRDTDSLRRAVAGCESLYHCAADYRLWVRDPAELYDANVEGTRRLLTAAREAGVEKVVYTSSVGALGLEPDGSPANEDTPVSLEKMIGHYKRSKFLAERVVEEACDEGLAVVIVNPSTPVGDLDIKPTPTGQIILDFLNGRMPAYVDTGLNLVDVRDVAAGHLLAEQKGRVGEKYILGNRNLSLREILEVLSRLTGAAAPRFRVPHWVPALFAAGSAAVARLAGTEPRVSPESVRMSRHKMYFDSSKALRELGLPQTSVEEALERAVEWFRAVGRVEAQ
ncbi:MAG: hopanoid-associated sugar epimerase [Acidobacteriota bacterium]|nr:hopanoid-associated sugar epimerase [Acidobacteriota bacterium]